MAGYIGSKSSVTQVDGYNQAEADAEFVNDPNSVITVSGSNVGIGTSGPVSALDVVGTTSSGITVRSGGALSGLKIFNNSITDTAYIVNNYSGPLIFGTTNTERMRLDSSGNLLVGKTSASSSTSGVELRPDSGGYVIAGTATSQGVISLNRKTSDGDIAVFRKDGTTVGTIGSKNGALYIGSTTGSDSYLGFYSNQIIPTTSYGSDKDAVTDLGYSGSRFNDIYASNGTIQTSDRNEKQDIEVLSDAETRVAQACKGLLRKFRWKDAVAEKGDDARIHFGIIAQDLQDAFAAEGLDAGRYAMFISSTWWETQTEVPAVEAVEAVYEDVVIPAVLDEDGNEVEAERTEQQLVTEAVEAKEAYTRTDTYETQEEAPEGATERTRLGVRYPELLAFIIGAM